MRFIVGIALKRRTVTVLAIALILAAGAFTYRALPVELFPEIEFPIVTITTFYPSASPDAVARDVTAPIEKAIEGMDGLDSVQSISSENASIIIANFEFGTDMPATESRIASSVGGIAFPSGVGDPGVARIASNSFPVMQISVTGERDLQEIQQVATERVVPAISGVEGIYRVDVAGTVQRRVAVVVDQERLAEKGISLFQVSQALRENSVALPGGSISADGQTLPIKTTNAYTSLDDLRSLAVGYSAPSMGAPPTPGTPPAEPTLVTLGEVADVRLSEGTPTSISRTNGKRGIGISIIKDPDANSIDVTDGVLAALDEVGDLPPGVEVIVVSNDGPQVQQQIATLEREAILGLILAVTVVFAFFLTLRPTALRGALSTLRPTAVIGLSIPLSILSGVLLMSWQGLSLNFMTLGGLAISVGRVVDDSIVVLENIHRNIEGGRERWRAALDATVEVAPAIFASTLATIVVFAPLAFIQGLVGAFFFPFALAVSFALIASLVVALTAVPVLGAYLLRPGDLPQGVGEGDDLPDTNTWMQRVYTPILRWSLTHKALTLFAAFALVVASFGLLGVIPINLFGGGGDRFLSISMTLPPGTPLEATITELETIEAQVAEHSDLYVSTIGSVEGGFLPTGGVQSGFNSANVFAALRGDAPPDVSRDLREEMSGVDGRRIDITEVSQGPPQAGLEISVTGSDYADISAAARELLQELESVDGIENLTSDISEARDEIALEVDPARAAAIGLSAQQVAFQVSQTLVGQPVAQVEIDGEVLEAALLGSADSLNSVEELGAMIVAGPLGAATLADVADISRRPGPVTIARTDGARSARITGSITSDDTQAVGLEIQSKIDALDLPPGVRVASGGVFQQIGEEFQQIFVAMAVGIALIYLVMVASLGSLRNPFVIVTSMPLAMIGALAALAITGRSLGLAGAMGILMLIGIVVTNAVVLISFVEQLRQGGMSVRDALMRGGRIRLRPILMTALTTSIALLPLAAFTEDSGGIISAELATVVIGGLASSTFLTLIVVPVVYTLANDSIPALFARLSRRAGGEPARSGAAAD